MKVEIEWDQLPGIARQVPRHITWRHMSSSERRNYVFLVALIVLMTVFFVFVLVAGVREVFAIVQYRKNPIGEQPNDPFGLLLATVPNFIAASYVISLCNESLNKLKWRVNGRLSLSDLD